MRLSAYLVLLALVIGIACGPKLPPLDTIEGNPKPEYYSLKRPQGEVSLPSFFVGEHEALSSGCFQATTATSTRPVITEMVETAKREKKYEAALKADFEKAFIDAGVAVEAKQALMQNWETALESVSAFEIDAANARPDFTNAACRIPGLKWFDDNRRVVVGAMHAKKLTVKTSHSLDASQAAKIETAISKINTDLAISFQRAVASDGTFEMNAEDVFFGAITTKLFSERCKSGQIEMELGPGDTNSVTMCDGTYQLVVTKSQASSRYTVVLNVPGEGITSGELDIPPGLSQTVAVGGNRVVFVTVTPSGDKTKVDATVLLVGVLGAE